MDIIVLGIGPKPQEHKEDMDKIAGKNGKVLLIANFDELKKHLDEILEETCGKSNKLGFW